MSVTFRRPLLGGATREPGCVSRPPRPPPTTPPTEVCLSYLRGRVTMANPVFRWLFSAQPESEPAAPEAGSCYRTPRPGVTSIGARATAPFAKTVAVAPYDASLSHFAWPLSPPTRLCASPCVRHHDLPTSFRPSLVFPTSPIRWRGGGRCQVSGGELNGAPSRAAAQPGGRGRSFFTGGTTSISAAKRRLFH